MTLRTLDELAGTTPAPPILVIGSGPAGLTLALDLAAAGLDVLVTESGAAEPTEEARDLDRGEVVGEPLRFNGNDLGTEDVRMRVLGGASEHWTGMCRPLDPIDLRARSWRPGSGWPFGLDELEPWYRRAEATLDLRPAAWDAAGWHAAGGSAPPFDSDALVTAVHQFSPPVRFGARHREALAASGRIDVVLDATATELVTSADGRRVSEVVLRSRSGVEVVARPAGPVVVAVGGLETPRLLLASRARSAAGVANRSGLVGVGFMEHPHRWAGRAQLAAPDDLPLHRLAAPPGGAPPTLLWAGWAPSEATQEAEAIGNGSILLWFDGSREEAAAVPTAESTAVASLLGAVAGRPPTEAVVTMRVEQLPVEASQVRLSSSADRFGVPRLVLDWRVDDGVDRTMRRLVELLARELGAAGIGRVELEPQGTPLGSWPREIGNHPMGTARMSSDPARGVVDADLRCHDVEDLYVLGSAAFPTGGHANPTLTVVALAHRLAAHLAARSLTPARRAPSRGRPAGVSRRPAPRR